MWLIGGTKDSRILLEQLVEYHDQFIVSITTSYGKKLLENYNVKIIDKRLSKEEKKVLIENECITLILDTSHPYAEGISHSAMEIAKECGVEYLRFERKNLEYEGAKHFEDITSLVDYINLTCKGEKVLSTLGIKNLEDLQKIKDQENLFIRLLPVVISIQKAETLGFLAKNIIAIQGPFSKEFNTAIIKNYGIQYLITKESGDEGGEMEKVLACKEEGVQLLVLKRPFINYLKTWDSLQEIVDELKCRLSL
ncbi:precorrin-6A reductase [Sulfurospirillum multivorans]|uniref:precorrin-6A reductase n=1 Tax=Sulfurospirillum multivorans TaxID=66821 RepID=UPI00130D6640|nr:precorrin-6A reductase [Sulfurospirillum multivorans]